MKLFLSSVALLAFLAVGMPANAFAAAHKHHVHKAAAHKALSDNEVTLVEGCTHWTGLIV